MRLISGARQPAPRPEPPGWESWVLRSLLRWAVWGTLFLAEPSIFVRIFDWDPSVINSELTVITVDIAVIAVLILYWTILFTVGLAALITRVIKGYYYTADSYPLPDSERPRDPD